MLRLYRERLDLGQIPIDLAFVGLRNSINFDFTFFYPHILSSFPFSNPLTQQINI